MSRDYGEVEKEFLADLENRTGHGLDEWMAAIDVAGLSDKNAIIDWLRPQGFTFAHASWLERIHHNGGKPVYPENNFTQNNAPGTAPPQIPKTPSPPAHAAPPNSSAAPHPVDTAGLHAPQRQPPAPPVQAVPSQPLPRPSPPPLPIAPDDTKLEALIERGKAYRPLARHLLETIARQVPGASPSPADDLIVFRNPAPFAALLVTPRGLRLGLILADPSPATGFVTGNLSGIGKAMTHTIQLTDARQIDNGLASLIAQSERLANHT